MKPTKNNQRRRFLAQYVGQKVLIPSTNKKMTITYNNIVEIQMLKGIVLLKPLNGISDDAKVVSKLLGYKLVKDVMDSSKQLDKFSIVKILESFDNRPSCLVDNPEVILSIYDFLCLNGYAMNWNDISIKEQIKNKWIQLKFEILWL